MPSDLAYIADSAGLAAVPAQQASLVDLLDRLLGAGVVIHGDVTISLAGVDLITVNLRALVGTVRETA